MTSVSLNADGDSHGSLSINRCIRRFETNIAANSLLRRSVTSAHNTKTEFGVTKALLGRSASAQFPESSNDVALTGTFQERLVEKIADIRPAMYSRATKLRPPLLTDAGVIITNSRSSVNLRWQRLHTLDGSF